MREKRITKDYDGDEIKIWSKNGIHIYEDSWWIKELDNEGNILEFPISNYPKDEIEPVITFMFATYIKGDGRFKSGFSINTDCQLKNLIYALTSKEEENI